MAARTRWRHWKERVRIGWLLEATGHGHRLRRAGNRLWGPCPVHHGDNPHAFQVDLERNLWFCFTRCARGGDVIELARCLAGGCWQRAAHCLEQLSQQGEPPGHRAQQPADTPTTSSEFRPFKQTLRLDAAHPFLLRMGLRPSTVRRFEAGAWSGPGFLEATIAVRLHDPRGDPLGYAGRRLDAAAIARWGKWKWPPRFPKASTLRNWHRVQPENANGLIVVESPWSVMKLSQAGFNNVVAICGLAISPAQRYMLCQAPRVALFLDGDEAGFRASARNLASNFHPNIRVIHPPENLDPADLTEAQLVQLLTRRAS